MEDILRKLLPMSFLYRALGIYLFFDRRERSAATGYIFHDDNVLVIKQSYGGKEWTYPGGFLHKNEVPEIGLRREVFEEVGLKLTQVKLIEKTPDSRKNRHITVYRFYCESETKDTVADKLEVVETRWVPIGEIKELIPGDAFIDRAIEIYERHE